MHTERLVAARELTPEIYSNKVGKVDLGFAFHYSLNEKFQEWVKKTFQEWDDYHLGWNFVFPILK